MDNLADLQDLESGIRDRDPLDLVLLALDLQDLDLLVPEIIRDLDLLMDLETSNGGSGSGSVEITDQQKISLSQLRKGRGDKTGGAKELCRTDL
jgi:hypothetical protein